MPVDCRGGLSPCWRFFHGGVLRFLSRRVVALVIILILDGEFEIHHPAVSGVAPVSELFRPPYVPFNTQQLVYRDFLSSWMIFFIPKLVGGLEHFLFSHILGIIIPIDFHIFQRGSNHQPASHEGSYHLLILMEAMEPPTFFTSFFSHPWGHISSMSGLYADQWSSIQAAQGGGTVAKFYGDNTPKSYWC